MDTIVMKFGGASCAKPSQFAQIAKIILEKKKNYHVVVVISAMEGVTNSLLGLAHEVYPDAPAREKDMLISVGERISSALLAMALAKEGAAAISFTGSQSGIITTENHSDARIVDVRPQRILETLVGGSVAIVAGFQGVSRKKDVTTLGRGGSDTTAVALAAALKASHVEFYKDVPGIFPIDPKVAPSSPYRFLSYPDALQIACKGAKVLHERAILLAQKNRLPLRVLSFIGGDLSGFEGTWIKEENSEGHLESKSDPALFETIFGSESSHETKAALARP